MLVIKLRKANVNIILRKIYLLFNVNWIWFLVNHFVWFWDWDRVTVKSQYISFVVQTAISYVLYLRLINWHFHWIRDFADDLYTITDVLIMY